MTTESQDLGLTSHPKDSYYSATIQTCILVKSHLSPLCLPQKVMQDQVCVQQ